MSNPEQSELSLLLKEEPKSKEAAKEPNSATKEPNSTSIDKDEKIEEKITIDSNLEHFSKNLYEP